MVSGPPWPSGGDDNDLVCLILPDLHLHLLEQRDWGGKRKETALSMVGTRHAEASANG